MNARVDPRITADALDGALARLAMSLDAIDVDDASRAIGSTRRDVIVALLGHLDRANAALHPHRTRDGRAPADPADARAVAVGGGADAATAIGARRNRLAEAFEHALERAAAADADLQLDDDLIDELDALLARVELAHVSLDAGYDLIDLPPASVAACARVSDAFERTRLPGEPRIRPTARRRRGIASPRGRGSS